MKKLVYFFPVLLVIALATPSCGQTGKDSSKTVLPVEEYAKQLAALKDAQKVDVRTPDEYNSGHIEGFSNIDWQGNSFEAEAAKLDKNKPVMIYCRSGRRSAAAHDALLKMGFKNVIDLKGGITAWQDAGKPVTP